LSRPTPTQGDQLRRYRPCACRSAPPPHERHLRQSGNRALSATRRASLGHGSCNGMPVRDWRDSFGEATGDAPAKTWLRGCGAGEPLPPPTAVFFTSSGRSHSILMSRQVLPFGACEALIPKCEMGQKSKKRPQPANAMRLMAELLRYARDGYFPCDPVAFKAGPGRVAAEALDLNQIG
jgi:hypothetical protein